MLGAPRPISDIETSKSTKGKEISRNEENIENEDPSISMVVDKQVNIPRPDHRMKFGNNAFIFKIFV